MKNDKPSQDSQQLYKIPDLDIIDLEQEHAADGSAQDSRQGEGTDEEDGIRTKKRTPLSYLNLHVVLLVVFLLFVAGLIYKIANFGVPINLDEIFADGPGNTATHSTHSSRCWTRTITRSSRITARVP